MEDKIELIKCHLRKFLEELKYHSQVKSELHESGSGPHNDLIKKCLVQEQKEEGGCRQTCRCACFDEST